METAKKALLLLAIDPRLQGVLIAGGPGTAKSVLCRACRSLVSPAPFVEVPLGVTADRLSGGLDLERTLLTGRRCSFDGLLAQASGGFLFVDDINLLDPSIACQLAGAGVALIGTYDPGEGEVSGSLFDSVGIHVTDVGHLSGHEHVEMLTRAGTYDRDSAGFNARYAAETASLRASIAEARSRMPELKITAENRRRLSLAALSLGIASHRADIFAVRLALAHAALMGRSSVEEEDLKAAVEFVLLPRAGVVPQQRAAMQNDPQPRSQQDQPSAQAIEDLVIQALDSRLPEDILNSARSNGSGHARRRKSENMNWRRGRYVRTVADKREKIALEATLRAAAPFQLRRQQSQEMVIRITAEDLRYKQFKQKAGILIIFAVDASGSMALNRMNHAKGALMRLLGQAYLHRDKVALVSFRGTGAQVLLPPTRSVELAKRALDALPVGGGTPLAAGIEAALHLARLPRGTDVHQAMLVLLTDGSANVTCKDAPREAVWSELADVCAAFRHGGMPSVVIDTKHQMLSGGEAQKLARMLGGKYVYLQRPDGDSVHKAVSAFAETVRN